MKFDVAHSKRVFLKTFWISRSHTLSADVPWAWRFAQENVIRRTSLTLSFYSVNLHHSVYSLHPLAPLSQKCNLFDHSAHPQHSWSRFGSHFRASSTSFGQSVIHAPLTRHFILSYMHIFIRPYFIVQLFHLCLRSVRNVICIFESFDIRAYIVRT